MNGGLDAFVGLVGRAPTITASSPFLAASSPAADRRIDDVDALRRELVGQLDGGGLGLIVEWIAITVPGFA